MCTGLWEPCSLTPNLLINSEGSQLTKAWKPHMAPSIAAMWLFPLYLYVFVSHVRPWTHPPNAVSNRKKYKTRCVHRIKWFTSNLTLFLIHIPSLLRSVAPWAYFKCLNCWIISWCCGRCLVWQRQYVSDWFDCRASVCYTEWVVTRPYERWLQALQNKTKRGRFVTVPFFLRDNNEKKKTSTPQLKKALSATCEPINRICLAKVDLPYCSAHNPFH